MSYTRVIPRDLFCEGSLKTMLGRVAILLGETQGHSARFRQDQLDAFDVEQDQGDGSISLPALVFEIHGQPMRLFRPLNSRSKWALFMVDPATEDEVCVFDDEGNFSDEMLEAIGVRIPGADTA